MNTVTRQPEEAACGEWACLWGVWGLCGALVVVRAFPCAFFSSSREASRRRDARGDTGVWLWVYVCPACMPAVCVCPAGGPTPRFPMFACKG